MSCQVSSHGDGMGRMAHRRHPKQTHPILNLQTHPALSTMRVGSLLSLVPLVLSLRSLANTHSIGDHTLESRDFIDELRIREPEFNSLDPRNTLSDISIRELIDELSDRLERRAFKFTCKRCKTGFDVLPSGDRGVCGKPVNVPHIYGINQGKLNCAICNPKATWNDRPKGMEAVCYKEKIMHDFGL
ncbi:hypothetical protein DFP72DRAFT_1175535 [Ephemerocybe angulata]|uniref:Uncharacterized protein n=1 Tax=Ephemerocybe angulata TaxID=980116 RepID=A0A8H6LYG3_9AGAR|nr:hypothetical protein DFP72DRAFT_1175535 [Tulosesus angulatus]